MSDDPGRAPADDLGEAPVSPGDVASAARSCQVIILILLALVAIACVVVAVALLR
jgi:hypothetical protein